MELRIIKIAAQIMGDGYTVTLAGVFPKSEGAVDPTSASFTVEMENEYISTLTLPEIEAAAIARVKSLLS